MDVTLREITKDTVGPVIKLPLGKGQERFVAPNAVSLAQALFSPEAWYRAVYLGDEPVGFVMLEDESLMHDPPKRPRVMIWRLMIASTHQRSGIGGRVLDLVKAHVRAAGLYTELLVSYVPEEGSPAGFYAKHGFEPTGEMEDGEVVLRYRL